MSQTWNRHATCALLCLDLKTNFHMAQKGRGHMPHSQKEKAVVPGLLLLGVASSVWLPCVQSGHPLVLCLLLVLCPRG